MRQFWTMWVFLPHNLDDYRTIEEWLTATKTLLNLNWPEEIQDASLPFAFRYDAHVTACPGITMMSVLVRPVNEAAAHEINVHVIVHCTDTATFNVTLREILRDTEWEIVDSLKFNHDSYLPVWWTGPTWNTMFISKTQRTAGNRNHGLMIVSRIS